MYWSRWYCGVSTSDSICMMISCHTWVWFVHLWLLFSLMKGHDTLSLLLLIGKLLLYISVGLLPNMWTVVGVSQNAILHMRISLLFLSLSSSDSSVIYLCFSLGGLFSLPHLKGLHLPHLEDFRLPHPEDFLASSGGLPFASPWGLSFASSWGLSCLIWRTSFCLILRAFVCLILRTFLPHLEDFLLPHLEGFHLLGVANVSLLDTFDLLSHKPLATLPSSCFVLSWKTYTRVCIMITRWNPYFVVVLVPVAFCKLCRTEQLVLSCLWIYTRVIMITRWNPYSCSRLSALQRIVSFCPNLYIGFMTKKLKSCFLYSLSCASEVQHIRAPCYDQATLVMRTKALINGTCSS